MDDRCLEVRVPVAAAVSAGRSSASIRQVRRWVSLRLAACDHEIRVMRAAVVIFDLLRPLHGLGSRHRRMLRIGALLHDIGRVQGSRRHHIRGQRMILDGMGPRLASMERRFAAYAARHHRGRSPDYSSDAAHFPLAEHRSMRILLAILRTADALDKRNLTPPTLLLRRRGRVLNIELRIAEQWRKSRKAFSRRRKFRMLEDQLGLAVRLAMLPM